MTAQVVATPLADGITFFDSQEALEDLAEIEARVADLDNVVGISEPSEDVGAGPEVAAASGAVSPDGRIALIRVQYPVIEALDATDLREPQGLTVDLARARPCRSRWVATCSLRSRKPETGVGEVIGWSRRSIILLVAFGSFIAMGLPIGLTLIGLGVGVSCDCR